MGIWKSISDIAADVAAGRVSAAANVEKSLQIIVEK